MIYVPIIIFSWLIKLPLKLGVDQSTLVTQPIAHLNKRVLLPQGVTSDLQKAKAQTFCPDVSKRIVSVAAYVSQQHFDLLFCL